MLIVTSKRYKKEYVVGGRGLFDTIGNVFGRWFTSDAAKQLTSAAAKEIGKKALNVSKTVAFDASKNLTNKLFSRKPNASEITQKSKDTLRRLLNQGPSTNVVEIQDLVRKLNGGGVKVVCV